MKRFDRSEDAQRILEMMRATRVGQILAYKAISQELGRKTQRSAEPGLRTALKAALKEGLVFHAIAGTGYKRVDSNVAVQIAVGFNGSVRRKARKGISVIDSTNGKSDITANNRALGAVQDLRFRMTLEITGRRIGGKLQTHLEGKRVTNDGVLNAVNQLVQHLITARDAEDGGYTLRPVIEDRPFAD